MSQIVCQAAAAQSGDYGDYQQSAMYIPVSGLYYQQEPQVLPGTSNEAAAAEVTDHVLMEQQDGTLLLYVNDVQNDTSNTGDVTANDEGRPGLHVDVKFCKQEMDFLHENYEVAEGASLPRSVIYNQYLRYCRHQLGNIMPMNPASFGKLLRLVFTGIKTRRLGTRGHSKYHYYGIRLKPTSALSSLPADEDGQNSNDGADGQSASREPNMPTALQLQHQQFLGDVSSVLLDLGTVQVDDNELLPEGITVEHLSTFELMYVAHCEEILEAVKNMQLASIADIWHQFWNGPVDTSEDESEETLSPEIMNIIGRVESLQIYVRQADYTFYNVLVDILMPDVLRPVPSSLTLVLRNFAKNLEGWLDMSMANVAKEMVQAKKAAVSAFAQMLRRYTGLNHLAQAARTVLQNKAQVNKMYQDLCKVDFVHIQEQASWVCECDNVVVHQVEMEVKKIFQHHYGLEQWAGWLDEVTTHLLQEHIGSPDFARAARQLILKWTFYSSLVLRDLTLRSASSFGAFHLIRLLFDEYVFYAVEHKVAAATGVSVVAAFGNIKQFVDFSQVTPLDAFIDQSFIPDAQYVDHNGSSVDTPSQGYNMIGQW